MIARMDAAVTVDAQNAPTATWKTAQNAVSHSAHTHHRLAHEIPDTPPYCPAVDVFAPFGFSVSFCTRQFRSSAT